MTRPKHFKDGDSLFRYALELCIDGVPSAPRGMKVKEVPYPVVLILENPACPLILSPSRRMNYRFGMAEAMWILSGSDSVDSIAKFNKRMASYSDDSARMWGAYGPRLMGQLPHVIETLKRDSDSRQAVVMTWRPMVHEVQPSCDSKRGATAFSATRAAGIVTESDMVLSREVGVQRTMFPLPNWDGFSWRSKDVPCTVAWHFTIRDNKLILTVFMRSNDVWLGLPYDLLSFTTVQRVVASMLGVEPGEYRHVVSNLHMYEENDESVVDVLCSKHPKRKVVLPPFKVHNLSAPLVTLVASDVLHNKLDSATDAIPGFDAYYAVIHKQYFAWPDARHVPTR